MKPKTPGKSTLTSLWILFFSIAPCAAQQDVSAKLDRFVKAEMRQQKIPGISLAVVRKGRVLMLKSYGFANLEHRIPVKPETVFQSGSIGKQFTAAAIMILVEEGRISLDDKLSKYFPDAPETWKNITVQHLLAHTSGMGDYPPEIDLRRDYTEGEYLEFIKKSPLSFEPGARWDYSNLGYVTLGILIRTITGQSYGDFLQERIFKPLRMMTARVISEADIVPNRAAGYRLVNGILKNQEWVSPSTNSTADGSLYFTVLDLAKWDASLYTQRPLKQSSLNRIWTPATLNDGRKKAYGFGWHADNMHNRRVVYHGGAWQGFKSSIVRFPDDELTIIFFANSWDTKDFKLTRGLVAIFFPEFALPDVSAIEDKEPAATLLVRGALLHLAKGSTNSEVFTPALRGEVFPERAKQLGKMLDSLSVPDAVIHTSELVERRDETDLRVYRYLLHDMASTLSCTVKLTRDNKIAALEISQLKK